MFGVWVVGAGGLGFVVEDLEGRGGSSVELSGAWGLGFRVQCAWLRFHGLKSGTSLKSGEES